MTLLITRPNYDDATGYLFVYAQLIINEAEKHNIKTIDLKRPRLTRENLSNIILKQQPSLIFFNAHGDEKIIYGDKTRETEEILIQEGKNHKLLENRITYARACWSAASLGKACTKTGGCFIGYNVPFSFWIDERWSAKPLNDGSAKLFLEPSNLIVSSLLKGNTTKEAFDKSKNTGKDTLLKLLKKEEEPGVTAQIMILWNNIQGQEILGDKNMRFT